MHHGDRYPQLPGLRRRQLLQAGDRRWWRSAACWAGTCSTRRSRSTPAAGEYKHPTPYDFFDTFEDVSGQDLSWFWRTWFFETWRLDQAIDSVATVGDSLEVGDREPRQGADAGASWSSPGPTGKADSLTVPVDVWLGGAKRTTVRVAREPAVKSIEIDPGHEFPDVNRDNQRWPR